MADPNPKSGRADATQTGGATEFRLRLPLGVGDA